MKRRGKITLRSVGTKAVTLIELTVTISIISLLLCLLLPALGRARVAAKQTVCQSRLREWGLAFESYAAASDGYYPHTDGRDRTSSDPVTDADRADAGQQKGSSRSSSSAWYSRKASPPGSIFTGKE